MTDAEPDDIIQAIGDMLSPTLDRMSETWAAEGPAARARCDALGIEISTMGGNCPVQIEGRVDGLAFYFRARGEEYQFHVAKTQAAIFEDEIHYVEKPWGDGPYAAGWMDLHIALGLLCDEVEVFRATARNTAAIREVGR